MKKIIRHFAIASILAAVMVFSVISSRAETVSATIPDPAESEHTVEIKTYNSFSKALFDRVNKYREWRGIDPLEWDDRLYEVAEIRAKEVSEKLSHQRPNGSWPESVFKELGISYNVMGENILAYVSDVNDSFDTWYKSEPHRAAIENSKYKKSAIYVYHAPDGNTYVAQEFMY